MPTTKAKAPPPQVPERFELTPRQPMFPSTPLDGNNAEQHLHAGRNTTHGNYASVQQNDSSDDEVFESQSTFSSSTIQQQAEWLRQQQPPGVDRSGAPSNSSPPSESPSQVAVPTVQYEGEKRRELDKVEGIGQWPTVAGFNQWKRNTRYVGAGASATPKIALRAMLQAER